MKKMTLLAITLLATSYTALSFGDEQDNPKRLNDHSLVSALINPNAESAEFSMTRDNAVTETEDETVYINAHLKVVPKKKFESNHSMHYSIDAIYPQITGLTMSDAERAFNARIMTMINEEMQQFKNSVKLDMPHMQTLPKEVRNNNFKIDYDIDVIHELGIVSVRFVIQGMQAGRAHPYRLHRVLNFDLLHNKELSLNDLFKQNANFLQALSLFSSNKLKETIQEKDKWMIDEGSKAVAKNFKNWNIEKDAILITFDEYQVAPYVYGPQEVEIPLSALQTLLSPQAQMISRLKTSAAQVG